MKASEFICEYKELDEYRLRDKYDPTSHLVRGDQLKNRYKPVKTPLTQFNVRYDDAGKYHDYYFYDKKTGRCVGLFTLEPKKVATFQFRNLLKPGVEVVTPHMALAPEAQRQGVSTQAYSTFLQSGPWVFMTDEHTKGASKLWDSLVTGDIVSFYASRKTDTMVTTPPSPEDVRFLGPRDRFNLS